MNAINKILIIRLTAIGDTIHTIPLAAALKKQFPNVKIGWVVEDKAKQFVENNPLIDDVFVLPRKKWKTSGNKISNFKELLTIVGKIRSQHYDIAIDTQQLLKSGIILGISGAKRRITMKDAREFSFIFANEIISNKAHFRDLNYHVINRNLEFAAYLGCHNDNVEFVLPNPQDLNKVNELLKTLDKSLKTVVLAPATTWENKHLDNIFWANIIDGISDKANIIITGSPADIELVNDILNISNNKNVLNLCAKTDLLELSAIFKNSDIVISPDSGSAHIAWATGKPFVITLFTSTSAKRNAPFGNNTYSVQSTIDCSPCFKRKCRNIVKNACRKAVSAEEVLNLVRDIIK